MNFREAFLFLRPRWRLMILCSIATAFFVFLFGLFAVKYEAKGGMLLRPLGADSLKLSTQPRLGAVFSEHISLVQQQGVSYLQLIRSREVVRETARRLNMEKKYSGTRGRVSELIKQPLRLIFYGRLPAVEQSPLEQATDFLARQINANLILNSSVMTVTVGGKDATQAARTVNTLMEVFQDSTRKNTTREAEETEKFLEQELAETRRDQQISRELNRRLLDDLRLPGVEDLSAELSRINLRIQGLANRQEEIAWQRDNIQNKIAVTAAQMGLRKEHNRLSYTMSQNPLLQSLQQRLLDQRLEYKRQSTDFTDSSVVAKALREQIELTEKALSLQVTSLMTSENFQTDPVWADLYQQKAKSDLELALIPFEEKQNTEIINQLQAQANRIIETRPQFSTNAATLKSLTTREEEMLAAINVSKTYAARQIGEVDIFQRAEAPRYPLLNNVPLMIYVLFGAIVGALLPCGILLFQWHLQRRDRITGGAREVV